MDEHDNMSNTVTPQKENQLKNITDKKLIDLYVTESTAQDSIMKGTTISPNTPTNESTSNAIVKKEKGLTNGDEGEVLAIDLTSEDENESEKDILENINTTDSVMCDEVEDQNTNVNIKREKHVEKSGNMDVIELNDDNTCQNSNSTNDSATVASEEEPFENENTSNAGEAIDLSNEDERSICANMNDTVRENEKEPSEISEEQSCENEKITSKEAIDQLGEDERVLYVNVIDMLTVMEELSKSDNISKGVLLGCRIARDFSADYNCTYPIYHVGTISAYHPCASNERRLFQKMPVQMCSKPKLDKGMYFDV